MVGKIINFEYVCVRIFSHFSLRVLSLSHAIATAQTSCMSSFVYGGPIIELCKPRDALRLNILCTNCWSMNIQILIFLQGFLQTSIIFICHSFFPSNSISQKKPRAPIIYYWTLTLWVTFPIGTLISKCWYILFHKHQWTICIMT